MADTGAIVDVLGGSKALRRRVARQEELRERVKAGLPYAALASVVERIHMVQDEITDVLHLTPRTLARRKAQGILDPDESDRLVRFARVIAHTTEVLGTLEKAALWLRRDLAQLLRRYGTADGAFALLARAVQTELPFFAP